MDGPSNSRAVRCASGAPASIRLKGRRRAGSRATGRQTIILLPALKRFPMRILYPVGFSLSLLAAAPFWLARRGGGYLAGAARRLGLRGSGGTGGSRGSTGSRGDGAPAR